ncbi:MAG: hypothetical protein DRN95_08625 [Candidatus Hydrothermarchaeota archaeon]|nr:MAG: hypothetical protein DRN95_08625 [Candidatus Hydrothermarchaeota archaeon]
MFVMVVAAAAIIPNVVSARLLSLWAPLSGVTKVWVAHKPRVSKLKGSEIQTAAGPTRGLQIGQETFDRGFQPLRRQKESFKAAIRFFWLFSLLKS